MWGLYETNKIYPGNTRVCGCINHTGRNQFTHQICQKEEIINETEEVDGKVC